MGVFEVGGVGRGGGFVGYGFPEEEEAGGRASVGRVGMWMKGG